MYFNLPPPTPASVHAGLSASYRTRSYCKLCLLTVLSNRENPNTPRAGEVQGSDVHLHSLHGRVLREVWPHSDGRHGKLVLLLVNHWRSTGHVPVKVLYTSCRGYWTLWLSSWIKRASWERGCGVWTNDTFSVHKNFHARICMFTARTYNFTSAHRKKHN